MTVVIMRHLEVKSPRDVVPEEVVEKRKQEDRFENMREYMSEMGRSERERKKYWRWKLGQEWIQENPDKFLVCQYGFGTEAKPESCIEVEDAPDLELDLDDAPTIVKSWWNESKFRKSAEAVEKKLSNISDKTFSARDCNKRIPLVPGSELDFSGVSDLEENLVIVASSREFPHILTEAARQFGHQAQCILWPSYGEAWIIDEEGVRKFDDSK